MSLCGQLSRILALPPPTASGAGRAWVLLSSARRGHPGQQLGWSGGSCFSLCRPHCSCPTRLGLYGLRETVFSPRRAGKDSPLRFR